MSQPGSRFVAARLLVIGQLSMVALYLAGAVVPYLLRFTFQGTDHCSRTTGCQAPGDVFDGPTLVLLMPAMIIAIVAMAAVLFLLMSFTSLARRRREMSDALRRWILGAAGLTLAFRAEHREWRLLGAVSAATVIMLLVMATPPGWELFDWYVG